MENIAEDKSSGMEWEGVMVRHSRQYGERGKGGEGGLEGRILGLLECAEGEGAPVSQEEEEAGWTPTLPNTRTLNILQQGKDWKLIQGECFFYIKAKKSFNQHVETLEV